MPKWWNRPNKTYDVPSPANAQPDNGILGQIKPQPQVQIAQGDQTPTAPNRLHEYRTDAMEALGLPDLAPPSKPVAVCQVEPPPEPPAAPTQTFSKSRRARKAIRKDDSPSELATRLEAIEINTEATKAQMLADIELDEYASKLNNQAQINAALSAQHSYEGKCSDHTDDELIELLERGYLQIEVARLWNVSPTVLLRYIRATPERSARAQEARVSAGQACDAKAMEVLRTATPETAYKARSIAAFLQWRARMLSPEYVDTSRLKVEGGLKIEHMEPEREPITTLIAEALKPFAPPPRLIEVQDNEDP